jgi:hypothetical protein
MDVKLRGVMMAPTQYGELCVSMTDDKVNDFIKKCTKKDDIVKIKLRRTPKYYLGEAENLRGKTLTFHCKMHTYYFGGKQGKNLTLEHMIEDSCN